MATKQDRSYRYSEIDNTRFRYFMTGQVRFRLLKKMFQKEPVLVLQIEEQCEQYKKATYGQDFWSARDGTDWRDADLKDLTVMDISRLSIVREGGEMPVCFRPLRSLWEWKLVLQIMNGHSGAPNWSDAKLGDLLFKEGKILGGVGLVAR
jgi:hypothetical protein